MSHVSRLFCILALVLPLCAQVKITQNGTKTISVEIDGKPFDTGLRKFGALLADGAEIGCNSVLNPGSIIGRGAVIYPNTNWRGILAANQIVKNKAQQEIVGKK